MYAKRQNKEKASRVLDRPKVRNAQAFSSKRIVQLTKYEGGDKTNGGNFYCFEAKTDSKGRAESVCGEMKGPVGLFDGGAPRINIIGWDALNSDKRGRFWVRFHIWNQKLGGPGNDTGNLVPATKGSNSSWLYNYETTFKEKAPKGICFRIFVNGYYSGIPDGFPMELKGKYWNFGQKEPSSENIRFPFLQPSAVDLSETDDDIYRISRIPASEERRTMMLEDGYERDFTKRRSIDTSKSSSVRTYHANSWIVRMYNLPMERRVFEHFIEEIQNNEKGDSIKNYGIVEIIVPMNRNEIEHGFVILKFSYLEDATTFINKYDNYTFLGREIHCRFT